MNDNRIKRKEKNSQRRECGKKEQAVKREKQCNKTNSISNPMFLITVIILDTAFKEKKKGLQSILNKISNTDFSLCLKFQYGLTSTITDPAFL